MKKLMDKFSRFTERAPLTLKPNKPKVNPGRPVANKNIAILGIILMFAALGSFMITQSNAATSAKSVEAEAGVRDANNKAIKREGVAGASGNAVVTFTGGGGSGGVGDGTTTGNGGGTTNGGNPGAGTIDPPNNLGPNGIPGNWKSAFNDDFNGNELNNTVWTRCNPSFNASCVPFNNELQKFNAALTNNDNIVVSGGQLHLVANRKGGDIWSGTISTGPNKFGYPQPGYKGFSYTYGVYEGRVRFPKGKGFWPSLWQLPVEQQKLGGWPNGGEYDVVEYNGSDPTTGHFTVHKPGNSCGGSACNGVRANIGDISTAFHTFALDWRPDSLTWYFDGRQVHKVTDKSYVQNHAFYIIANFSMCPQGGGCWGGQTGGVDGSTPFPSSMDIDYLRVWQLANGY